VVRRRPAARAEQPAQPGAGGDGQRLAHRGGGHGDARAARPGPRQPEQLDHTRRHTPFSLPLHDTRAGPGPAGSSQGGQPPGKGAKPWPPWPNVLSSYYYSTCATPCAPLPPRGPRGPTVRVSPALLAARLRALHGPDASCLDQSDQVAVTLS